MGEECRTGLEQGGVMTGDAGLGESADERAQVGPCPGPGLLGQTCLRGESRGKGCDCWGQGCSL